MYILLMYILLIPNFTQVLNSAVQPHIYIQLQVLEYKITNAEFLS